MNKKHKNKSKQGKSSEPTPKQLQENKCTENEIKECVPEMKSESVVPFEKQEVTENVPTEAPQPPKRQRKRVKKEQAIQSELTGTEKNEQNENLQDKTDSEKACLSTTCTEIIQIPEDVVVKDEAQNPQLIQSVVPIARKSKNKNKKKTNTSNTDETIGEVNEEIKESIETEKKNYGTIQESMSIIASFEQTVDQTKQQKRKNKRNKNKNESVNLVSKPDDQIAEIENIKFNSVTEKKNNKSLAIEIMDHKAEDDETKKAEENSVKKVTVDTEKNREALIVTNPETPEQTQDHNQQKKKNKKNKHRNESVNLDKKTENVLVDVENAASNPISEVKSKNNLPIIGIDNTDIVSSKTEKNKLDVFKKPNENETKTKELKDTIDELSFDESEWKLSNVKHKKKGKTNTEIQSNQQIDTNLIQEAKEVQNELKEAIELTKEPNTINAYNREHEIDSCKKNEKSRKNKKLTNKVKNELDSTVIPKSDTCKISDFEQAIKKPDLSLETKTETDKEQSLQKGLLETIEERETVILTDKIPLLIKDEIVHKILELPEKTPDSIEYPRSTSEHADTNDNMLIKEIKSSEELFQKVTLEVPNLIPDTPLVKSSDISSFPVMTPMGTIELEKTNLKSKVIEVNDGLEELRLSIEKSLSELTSLENYESLPDLECYKIEELVATNESGKEISENIKIFSEEKGNIKRDESDDLISQNIEAKIHFKKRTNPISDKKLNNEISKSQTSEEKGDKNKYLMSDQKNDSFIETESDTIAVENNLSRNESNSGNQEMSKEINSNKEVHTFKEYDNTPTIQEKLHKESKAKCKKKNKQDFQKPQKVKKSDDCKSQPAITVQSEKLDQKVSKESETTAEKNSQNSGASKSDPKSESKNSENSTGKKTNKLATSEDTVDVKEDSFELDYDKIDKYEDAMTTSADDVNKSFEIIADEVFVESLTNQTESVKNDMISPLSGCLNSSEEDNKNLKPEKNEIESPLVSNPKNLLGHPDIPVSSNKLDYKKEKNKTPNTKRAEVKIKDSVDIKKRKNQPKETQTENQAKLISNNSLDQKPFNITNVNEDYVYKYSFRKVFLVNTCHVCKKDLKNMRVPCSFCNLFFYCSEKHKDEDWNQHQSLCFALSSVVQMKGLNFLYSDAKDVMGQNYRLLRMQAIVSCEKILQRKLMPCEQEAFLYPRICAEPSCREWKHDCLQDCEGCSQIAYCKDKPEHFPKTHQRWCKSYHLYQKLVIHQQTKGRLEPKLPTRMITNVKFQLPDKINELLAALYEERIDIDDMHYAALTQLATAPLTAAYSYQLYDNNMNNTFANGINKKSSFTVHLIGAELQFEADALNKWEIFFLHLRPDVKDLNVALIGNDMNPSNLPLELLSKIKLCQYCQESKRRLRFGFFDKKYYFQFYDSDDFNIPDIVCAFNPSIHRAFFYNDNDSWIASLKSIFKTRAPFCVTAYTPNELTKDLTRIKQCAESELRIVTPPSPNPYASIRPDRNFISDDEMPLIFKNYYYMILSSTS